MQFNSTRHLQLSSLPSSKIVHHPQRKPPSSSEVTSYSPSHQILAIHLWIYLFWIFHRDEITQDVASSTCCRVFKVPSHCRTSLVAQTVKHLPTMWETWVRSLGWEDLLEKEMATHSSTLAWKIPWTEEPGGPQSMGLQRVRHD